MKTQGIIVLFCLVFLLLTPELASAHILKASGSVGAVLHIAPDDDPVAGQQSDFFLQFKDKKNAFVPENCDCIVSIKQEGREVFSQPLFQNNDVPTLDNARFTFTFPQKAVYNLTIEGKPKEIGAFQPFTLSYDIRVAREVGAAQATTNANGFIDWTSRHMPHLIGSFFIAVFVIVAIIRERVATKNNKKTA